MAIRTTDDDTSQLGRLRDRIRSTLFSSDARSATDSGTEEVSPPRRDPDAPGNLFQCSTCRTVYIDAEKTECSNCEEAVEEVRSTLESSLGRP